MVLRSGIRSRMIKLLGVIAASELVFQGSLLTVDQARNEGAAIALH
jgi:hypothetical protein